MCLQWVVRGGKTEKRQGERKEERRKEDEEEKRDYSGWWGATWQLLGGSDAGERAS